MMWAHSAVVKLVPLGVTGGLVLLVAGSRPPDAVAAPIGIVQPGVESTCAITTAVPNRGDFGLRLGPDDPRLRDTKSPLFRRFLVYDEPYYATVDPSRIHVKRPRDPGETLRALEPVSPRLLHGQAKQVLDEPLEVKAAPDRPVTFYAPDFGTFENGKSSITVKADSEGRASAHFTPGSMHTLYRIVAASPECTGWVIFEVDALPQEDSAW